MVEVVAYHRQGGIGVFFKRVSDSVRPFYPHSFCFPCLDCRHGDWSYSSHFIINEGEAKEISETLALTSLSCFTIPGVPISALLFSRDKINSYFA